MPVELLAQRCRLTIKINPFSGYMAASSDLINILVQEHWTRARVMLVGSTLSQSL